MGSAVWDRRFLRLAKEVSTWSKDPSTKVGCVIVKEKVVEGLGYNGFPRGMADDLRLLNKDIKNMLVVHAEENAILNSRVDLKGATAYIWPLQPCLHCTVKLIQAGIKRVVIPRPSLRHQQKYNFDGCRSLLQECNVDLTIITDL